MFIRNKAKVVSSSLACCFLSPMSRKSVLEELRVKRFAVIRKTSVEEHSVVSNV